jgi:putative DNA primase/helicase
VLELLLGDYARQAAPDLLIAKAGDRHPTEIADLRGARLLATVETGEGRRLAENLVKADDRRGSTEGPVYEAGFHRVYAGI